MEIKAALLSKMQGYPMFEAFQYAPTGMAVLEPDGRVLHLNRYLCNLMGYAEHESPSHFLLEEALHPSDRRSYRQTLASLIDNSYSDPVIVRFLGHDGGIAEAELTFHKVLDSENEPSLLLVYVREISRLDAVEIRYRANNETHESLILHNPAMILSVCLSGAIMAANPAAEQLSGYSCEELLGRDVCTLLDEGQAQMLWDMYKDSPLENPMAYETRLRTKNGSIIELGVKNVPIITDGTVIGLYVIARDITEIKRHNEWKDKAEQEMRETVRNQQGFTLKFKRIDGAYIHTLCDGELLYRLGLSPDKVVGKTLYEFAGLETPVKKEEYYRRAWEGEDLIYEGCFGDIWCMVSLRPIKKDGVVQEVIGSCVDITERKKTERHLVEAKEQFESLFISSPTAIDLLDKEGNVMRVNPAFESLYGWSNDELKGKPLSIIPDHRRDEYHLLSRQLIAGVPVVDYETERMRKDGTILTVCLTLAPLRDKEGRLFGFTGLTRNVTESKKAEELLRKADKLNVVGHLAAGLAHEIRNPLTSLRGFLQLLRSGHREKEQFYELMLSELDRINNILGELLIIAKPQVSHFQRKNLAQMLIDVLLLLEPQALLQSIQYHTVFEAAELTVHCSETELKQVFINIIKNGMEAMPQGGTLSVELSASWNNEVVIRISDEGVGIPEERIPRLGEPFYTTKEKGTGLGLMMCYKIIEAHRGSIAFTSKENGGTKVDVILPLCGDQQQF